METWHTYYGAQNSYLPTFFIPQVGGCTEEKEKKIVQEL